MSGEKEKLIQSITDSVKELHRGIDMHHSMIASILGESVDEKDLRVGLCHGHCREAVLRGAIKEAIETLEQTRKAFKSKKLELLRKRLTRVLIDPE
jgi:CCR4-NOT transcriptional regulation complex NOT5 subunit